LGYAKFEVSNSEIRILWDDILDWMKLSFSKAIGVMISKRFRNSSVNSSPFEKYLDYHLVSVTRFWYRSRNNRYHFRWNASEYGFACRSRLCRFALVVTQNGKNRFWKRHVLCWQRDFATQDTIPTKEKLDKSSISIEAGQYAENGRFVWSIGKKKNKLPI
jgi:hypothetical protein